MSDVINQMLDPKVIVGLGNIGKKYLNHRHNVGFMVCDYLRDRFKMDAYSKKFNNQVAHGNYKGRKIFLIKPQLYMNNSGDPVRQLISYYRCKIDQCLFIYDDIDILMGQIRFRQKGSAGTHNGMKSVISTFKTTDIHRLRIGIGPKRTDRPLDVFVLSDFSDDEKTLLSGKFSILFSSISLWIEDKFDEAQRLVHELPS